MTLILSCYNDKTNSYEDETSCDMWVAFLHGPISRPSLCQLKPWPDPFEAKLAIFSIGMTKNGILFDSCYRF